uniref:MADF domain-containing protein n=1 Tax=Anopheles gambiae TaxID=7165 RepID=A0A453Z0M1_ANOGA
EGTEATFVENNVSALLTCVTFLPSMPPFRRFVVLSFGMKTRWSSSRLWRAIRCCGTKHTPTYGNVKRLEDTWQLVADEMDLDVEDCKDKWNSLRAQFRRLRRKILQSSEDATGSDQIYQPSWYAYDAMTFLTDVIQHGKAKKRRLSSPRPKPEPQSNSNAPRTSTVRKSDDGFFLDSLEILNADDDEDQEQLSSIDGSPYPSDDEEEEYLEEQEQLLAEEKTCDEGEDPSPTEEDIEVSSRHPCDSERQRIAPFIEILSQRLLRKEKAQLEEIENELLKVLNKYPNARID